MLAILIFTLCIGENFVLATRDITDKKILITGAATGLGYNMAEKFLANGAGLVVIVDKNETGGALAAETLKGTYGEDKVDFIIGDVTTNLEEAYQHVLENHGCIDILVNNAGVMDETDPKYMLETNTVATILWSLKYFNLMRVDQTSDCGNGGVIINLSSLAGRIRIPYLYSYIGSKYAVRGFSRCLGHPYNERQTNVAVLTVCPGYTYTDMTKNMTVEDFQKESYEKFYSSQPWQEADAIGNGVLEIYKNAESGTIWDMIGGEDPVESPELTDVTLEDIDAL